MSLKYEKVPTGFAIHRYEYRITDERGLRTCVGMDVNPVETCVFIDDEISEVELSLSKARADLLIRALCELRGHEVPEGVRGG